MSTDGLSSDSHESRLSCNENDCSAVDADSHPGTSSGIGHEQNSKSHTLVHHKRSHVQPQHKRKKVRCANSVTNFPRCHSTEIVSTTQSSSVSVSSVTVPQVAAPVGRGASLDERHTCLGESSSLGYISLWQRQNILGAHSDNVVNESRVMTRCGFAAQRNTLEARAIRHLIHQRGLQQRNNHDTDDEPATTSIFHPSVEVVTFPEIIPAASDMTDRRDRETPAVSSSNSQTCRRIATDCVRLPTRSSILDVAINSAINAKGLHLQ